MFITEGIKMMRVSPWLGGLGLVLTFVLLTWQRFPAMFACSFSAPERSGCSIPKEARQLLAIPHIFGYRSLLSRRMTWGDFVKLSTAGHPAVPLTIAMP